MIVIGDNSLLRIIDFLNLLLSKRLIFFMNSLFNLRLRLKCLLILKHELFKFGKQLFFTLRDPPLNYFFYITAMVCLRKRPPFISDSSICLSLFFSYTQSLCRRLWSGNKNIFFGLWISSSIKFLSFELAVFLHHIVFQAGWRKTMPDAN